MAYARFARNCEWYIFWYSTKEDEERRKRGHAKTKEKEVLAIWHSSGGLEGPLFTYAEVSEMLRTSNFSRIPGYSETDSELISRCLASFVSDVDQERSAP